jgi:pantothenate kinase type III
MKLSLDLGNTTCSCCINLKRTERVSWEEAEKKLPEWIGKDDQVLFASVNPVRENMILNLNPSARKIGVDLPYPLKLNVADTVGADRVMAAYGAWLHCKRSAIIVDCGTAITIDAVSENRSFLGGIIFPGPALLSGALHQGCKLLPLVQPASLETFLGKTTEQAIAIGLAQGLTGLIERMIAGIRDELNDQRIPVYATGGYGKEWCRNEEVRYRAELIHEGIFDLFNQANSSDEVSQTRRD